MRLTPHLPVASPLPLPWTVQWSVGHSGCGYVSEMSWVVGGGTHTEVEEEVEHLAVDGGRLQARPVEMG